MPDTQICVCDQDNAPMLYSNVKTEYTEDNDFKEPHPLWRPHLLQGWAPDFIPKIVDDAVEMKLIDHLLHAAGDKSIATTKELAQKEGILAGTSGGGVLSCALEFAKTLEPGKTLLVMLPDTGERYLSTPLFADIPADMTEEEKAIAASTESPAPPNVPLPEVTQEALDFVNVAISRDPIVIFSLEYCEFCWTLTSFLNKLEVPFKKIDIDSFLYAKNYMGNKYRAAVSSITDCKTFPQFFINGKFVGGAVDACLMWMKGELQPALREVLGKDVQFGNYEGDPFEFLPKWMTQTPLRDR